MLPTRTAPSVPKALWDKLMAAAGPNGAKYCKSNRMNELCGCWCVPYSRCLSVVLEPSACRMGCRL